MHCKSYSHFFSRKFQHICVSLDVNFNESLTNDIVSFEHLGPGLHHKSSPHTANYILSQHFTRKKKKIRHDISGELSSRQIFLFLYLVLIPFETYVLWWHTSLCTWQLQMSSKKKKKKMRVLNSLGILRFLCFQNCHSQLMGVGWGGGGWGGGTNLIHWIIFEQHFTFTKPFSLLTKISDKLTTKFDYYLQTVCQP